MIFINHFADGTQYNSLHGSSEALPAREKKTLSKTLYNTAFILSFVKWKQFF
jgi:hypothetical protein